MSFQAMTWAMAQKPKGAKEKFVLIILANYASSETGECYPSMATISEDTTLSRDSVIRALKSLEDDGLISTRRRKVEGVNLPNYYSLNLQGVVAHSNQGSSLQQPPVVAPCNTNLSNEPINEPVIREKAEILSHLSSVLSPEVAVEVYKYRKGMKAKFTPYAAKLLAGKFAMCRSPDDAANKMISSGWQGFEPSWMDSKPRVGHSQKPTMVGLLDELISEMESADDIQRIEGGFGSPQNAGYLAAPKR